MTLHKAVSNNPISQFRSPRVVGQTQLGVEEGVHSHLPKLLGPRKIHGNRGGKSFSNCRHVAPYLSDGWETPFVAPTGSPISQGIFLGNIDTPNARNRSLRSPTGQYYCSEFTAIDHQPFQKPNLEVQYHSTYYILLLYVRPMLCLCRLRIPAKCGQTYGTNVPPFQDPEIPIEPFQMGPCSCLGGVCGHIASVIGRKRGFQFHENIGQYQPKVVPVAKVPVVGLQWIPSNYGHQGYDVITINPTGNLQFEVPKRYLT